MELSFTINNRNEKGEMASNTPFSPIKSSISKRDVLPETLEVENEDIDFKNIFKKFKRRRRIILAFTISCFTLASIYTGFKRIFSPTFQGNFTLLVNDPEKSSEISTKSALLEGLPESYRSALADRGAETDLDTLIEVLKSSAYLKPLAQEFNLNYPSLKPFGQTQIALFYIQAAIVTQLL